MFQIAISRLDGDSILGGRWLLLIALLQVPGPVSDGPSHEAREDEVEFAAEGPIILKIINVKVDIGGNTV